jgi:hypothetical protein
VLFLRISEGEDGRTAVPVFATTDPEIIAAVTRAVVRRLGGLPAPVTRLRGLSDPDEPGGR